MVLNVQSGTSSIFGMHIPLFGWTDDLTATFQTFYQAFFTSFSGAAQHGTCQVKPFDGAVTRS